LLPYIPFRMDFFRQGVEVLNPGVITFPLSCQTREGIESWLEWIIGQVDQFKREWDHPSQAEKRNHR